MSRKILIVDDQPDNLAVIVKIIEEDNLPYEVFQALNVELALKIAVDEHPDLIITDWEMPESDGITFIKQLKSEEITVDIPIIMCTGVMVSSQHLQIALEAGAMDYIRKPIDKVELLARINSALALGESYNQIKELNKWKDRIFSIIAHDLKTPVGNIRNFSQWILENDEEQNPKMLIRILDRVHHQSTTIYQTLETLLNWARCQNRDIRFEPVNCNISELIVEEQKLFKQSCQEKNIIVHNDFNDRIIGQFDPAMIATVIRNLIANAIKFSNEDSEVHISCKKANEEIIFCIRDHGVGIDESKIDLLFDRTKYHSTFDTMNVKGSGLGLKICKEFIDLHKGEISVKSGVNKGSRFCFTIPIN